MLTEAMKRMIAVRTVLVLDEPFWGTLALQLRLQEDPTCKTAWVNGRELGYNPTFIQELPTFTQCVAVFAHEVAHCVLGHPWRREGRDFRKWNEACDRALNPVLREAGFQLPEGCLFELDPSHAGKSAEWIFNRLPSTPKSSDKGDEGAESAGSETSEDSGKGQPGEQEADSPGSGTPALGSEQPADTSPVTGEVRDAPVGTDEDENNIPSEDQWQQAVQQAAKLAQGQGKLPAGLARLAEQAAESRVDWRSVLRRFVQETTNSDYSWTQPNRRYVAQGLYLPALHSEEFGPLVVAIDTSGSIDNTLLAVFGAELQAVVAEEQPRRVHVLYCDSRVQREDVFERGETIAMHPKGGGGTNFRPVFEAIERLEEPPVCVIYLTDLQGTFPSADYAGPPVLWATPNRISRYAQERVPFGEVVSIEE